MPRRRRCAAAGARPSAPRLAALFAVAGPVAGLRRHRLRRRSARSAPDRERVALAGHGSQNAVEVGLVGHVRLVGLDLDELLAARDVAPSCLSQRRIVPSSIVSDRRGITTSVIGWSAQLLPDLGLDADLSHGFLDGARRDLLAVALALVGVARRRRRGRPWDRVRPSPARPARPAARADRRCPPAAWSTASARPRRSPARPARRGRRRPARDQRGEVRADAAVRPALLDDHAAVGLRDRSRIVSRSSGRSVRGSITSASTPCSAASCRRRARR